MEHLTECQEILEQLKQDHPLTAGIEIQVSYEPVRLVSHGSVRGGALFIFNPGNVSVKVAMADPVPLRERLERMAHEYCHVIQRAVRGEKIDCSFTGPHETEAREFARHYVKEYMTQKCME
jgi:hypothetical protein